MSNSGGQPYRPISRPNLHDLRQSLRWEMKRAKDDDSQFRSAAAMAEEQRHREALRGDGDSPPKP